MRSNHSCRIKVIWLIQSNWLESFVNERTLCSVDTRTCDSSYCCTQSDTCWCSGFDVRNHQVKWQVVSALCIWSTSSLGTVEVQLWEWSLWCGSINTSCGIRHINLDIIRIKSDWVRNCYFIEIVLCIDSSEWYTIQLILVNQISRSMILNQSIINTSGDASQCASTDTRVRDDFTANLDITWVRSCNTYVFKGSKDGSACDWDIARSTIVVCSTQSCGSRIGFNTLQSNDIGILIHSMVSLEDLEVCSIRINSDWCLWNNITTSTVIKCSCDSTAICVLEVLTRWSSKSTLNFFNDEFIVTKEFGNGQSHSRTKSTSSNCDWGQNITDSITFSASIQSSTDSNTIVDCNICSSIQSTTSDTCECYTSVYKVSRSRSVSNTSIGDWHSSCCRATISSEWTSCISSLLQDSIAKGKTCVRQCGAKTNSDVSWSDCNAVRCDSLQVGWQLRIKELNRTIRNKVRSIHCELKVLILTWCPDCSVLWLEQWTKQILGGNKNLTCFCSKSSYVRLTKSRNPNSIFGRVWQQNQCIFSVSCKEDGWFKADSGWDSCIIRNGDIIWFYVNFRVSKNSLCWCAKFNFTDLNCNWKCLILGWEVNIQTCDVYTRLFINQESLSQRVNSSWWCRLRDLNSCRSTCTSASTITNSSCFNETIINLNSCISQWESDFLSIINVTLWVEDFFCWCWSLTLNLCICWATGQYKGGSTSFKCWICSIGCIRNSVWTNQSTKSIGYQSYIGNSCLCSTALTSQNHSSCQVTSKLRCLFSSKTEGINVQNSWGFRISCWETIGSIVWVGIKRIRWIVVRTILVICTCNSEWDWRNTAIDDLSSIVTHCALNSFTNLECARGHFNLYQFGETEVVDIYIIKEGVYSCERLQFSCSKLNVTRPHKVNNVPADNSVTQRFGINNFSYSVLNSSSLLTKVNSNITIDTNINSSTISTCIHSKTEVDINTCSLPGVPQNRTYTLSQSINFTDGFNLHCICNSIKWTLL